MRCLTAPRRCGLVVPVLVLVLLYLAAQAAFAIHEVGHLLDGEEAPCQVCELGGAPALPTVPISVAGLDAPLVPESRDQLPHRPFARAQRVHLPRAPPA